MSVAIGFSVVSLADAEAFGKAGGHTVLPRHSEIPISDYWM